MVLETLCVSYQACGHMLLESAPFKGNARMRYPVVSPFSLRFWNYSSSSALAIAPALVTLALPAPLFAQETVQESRVEANSFRAVRVNLRQSLMA